MQNMYKKVILLFFLGIFFFKFSLAYAGVVINEIMYAPQSGSSYEWVEIFNSGSESVDLAGWRFFYDSNGDKIYDPSESHPLTLQQGSNSTLSSFQHALIAKSPSVVTDYVWLNFSGTIFSATFSLSDEAKLIAIMDEDKVVKNSITYDSSIGGDKDSGNSLQLISSSWVAAAPTPGVLNQASASNDNTDDTNASNNTNVNSGTNTDTFSASCSGCDSSSSYSSSEKTEDFKIKVKIIAKTLAFTGIPFSIQAKVSGYAGEQFYGKYFWNFGDGDSKEARDSTPFSRSYFYPGEYPVSLEYYENYYSNIPDATAKIIIKAVPMAVSISKVGDMNDFFIELANNSDYEIDVSKWVLSSLNISSEKKFTLPKNTVILAKKKIVLSPKITNFNFEDAKNLKLSTSEGQLVFDYGNFLASSPAVIVQKPDSAVTAADLPLIAQSGKKETNSQTNKIKDNITEKAKDESQALIIQDLSATAISSDIPPKKSDNGHTYIPMIISFIFIGASAGAVYFIRQKRNISKAGDDFKILDG